ncbi:MAG: hypothetical protein A2138_19345 [Deltaproteobacteria bacterium RBG_16_71_12]|nr:MAG: hypothetical protein A2138_19345 [Deltaproteobacteria bacterium RBG_16_71_12]
MTRQLRIAACQMASVLGDVPGNMARAERLVDDAAAKGATWIVLPEFFPTSMAFDKRMDDAAQPLDGPALALLQGAARRHQAHVGGSFIAMRDDGHAYNTYVIARPDGSYGTHDKDQPTVWENCYYRGGNDDGVVDTADGKAGVAVCWEFIRWRTAKRLLGKVDLVVGGSCWPAYPRFPFSRALLGAAERRFLAMTADAFPRMARILGVPVAQAGHSGRMRSTWPLLGLQYASFFTGETQIVDAHGLVKQRMTAADGDGVVVDTVTLGERVPAQEPLGDSFWIPHLSFDTRLLWTVMNWHGERYYSGDHLR